MSCGETRPDRWFRTRPVEMPQLVTAAEVLDGRLPRDLGERYIHICGGCGHWLGAVHNGYFDHNPHQFDDPEAAPGFIDQLMESLCPKCGSAIFRGQGVVAQLSDAERLSRSDGRSAIDEYILQKADFRFWRGEWGFAVCSPTRCIKSDYSPRCPACGTPWSHDGSDFDFHHWDYEADVGCNLCRDCHTHIHRDMRAGEQAEHIGGDWKPDAMERLYRIATDNGLTFDSAAEFKARFNIPIEMDVERTLTVGGGQS